jgi:hypothetical protein
VIGASITRWGNGHREVAVFVQASGRVDRACFASHGEDGMGQGNIIKGAIACVAFACAGSAMAAEPSPAWRVCRAESTVQGGVVYLLQSAAFDTRPYHTFEERVLAQRPFEAPLKAMGAKALRDATVRCTSATLAQEEARSAGKTLHDEAVAAHAAAGVRVVEKPWVPVLSPEHQTAVLLVGLGELASPATLASGPEKWGLTREDYARLHNEALVKKAGLPGRRAALEKAAAAGDAYAQHLLAIRPAGQTDDLVMMKKAADQGLVRAMADYLGQAPWPADAAAAKARVVQLIQLTRLRSPHASFTAGLTLLQPAVGKGDQTLGLGAFLWSETQDYAPAQLMMAEDLIKQDSEFQRRQAISLAREAAAQGLGAAQDFLAKHPKP